MEQLTTHLKVQAKTVDVVVIAVVVLQVAAAAVEVVAAACAAVVLVVTGSNVSELSQIILE